ASQMDVPKEWLILNLHISRATLNRKEREAKSLSLEESERVLGMTTLIGQVEAMVAESGNPQGFEAAKWLSQWINTPIPALGGDRPVEYLDTIEGQKLIANLLATAQSGAYV